MMNNASDWLRPPTEPGQITRRQLLKAGGAGVLAMSQQRDGWASSLTPSADSRAVILVVMAGGASPWETFDPQPEAPEDQRGPFGSISSAIPGIQVSEYLPEVARRLRQLTLIRSLYHDGDPTHDAGFGLLTLGQTNQERWALSAVVARHLGPRRGMPPVVVLPQRLGPVERTAHARRSSATALVESELEPFIVGSRSSGAIDPCRLLHRVHRWGERYGVQDSYLTAGFRMGNPWEWDAEPLAVRAAFGATDFGHHCWLASRFVAAGTRLVIINMATTLFDQPNWDAHGRQPFRTFADYRDHLLPAFDRGFTALVDELHAQGRLDQTFVVATGEMGRTPWINDSGGRDHWPGVWSALVAGGGTIGGQVIGSSSRDGQPRERPVHVTELVATIHHALGLDQQASQASERTSICHIPELFG